MRIDDMKPGPEMPDICKDCPENRWCSLDPEMWKCEMEPVKALQGEDTQ